MVIPSVIVLVLKCQKIRIRSTWMNRSTEKDPLVTQRYMIHANNGGYVVHDSPLGTACCAAHLA